MADSSISAKHILYPLGGILIWLLLVLVPLTPLNR